MSQIITELARYTQELKTERKSVSSLITFMEQTTALIHCLFGFFELFLVSCWNVLHILVCWIWRIASDGQIRKECFLLCIPLRTISVQMRSSETKYRYTQRVARSRESDTWSPFYGQKAPFLYPHRLINLSKPNCSQPLSYLWRSMQ